MPGMNGFETARAHQVARTHAAHPDHLPHGDLQGRGVRLHRLLGRRGRLHVQAVPAGRSCARRSRRSSTCTSSSSRSPSRSSSCARASGRRWSFATCASCSSPRRASARSSARRWTRSSCSTPTATSRCSTARPSACSARRRTEPSGSRSRRFFPDGAAGVGQELCTARCSQRERRASPRRRSAHAFTARRANGETLPDRGVGLLPRRRRRTHLHADRSRRLRAQRAEEALREQAKSLARLGAELKRLNEELQPAAARPRARDDRAQPLLRVDEPRAAHADQRRARL